MPSSLTRVLSSTSVCSTSPPVSVCGTVTPLLARGFSRQCSINPSGLDRSPHLPLRSRSSIPRICLRNLPTTLEGIATPGPSSLRPPIAQSQWCGAGLFTCCPSPTPSGLGLGPPNPSLISIATEPSGIRWGRFSLPSRYSCQHSHSSPLQVAFQLPFSADDDAPLPIRRFRSFGSMLEPRWIVGAATHRPVSYYALFQGWLLLSQPPGCHRVTTTLPT